MKHKVKLLILDVDGIMTNGIIYYSTQEGPQQLQRGFHIRDGLGIQLLQKHGIKVAVISGKDDASITRRCQDLGISEMSLGQQDKTPAYERLKQKLQLDDSHIAYMGDDLPDLPLLHKVGFAATVPDAPPIIKKAVHYVTRFKGGEGAVREVCDIILQTC